MARTKESNGKVTEVKNSEITLDSYDSCAMHFPLLCLTIVWSCFEFQPVVFKLCFGKGKVTKGNNSVITLDRVMVLVFCTSSDGAWPLYEVVLNSNH
jgi:hypothetical protein